MAYEAAADSPRAPAAQDHEPTPADDGPPRSDVLVTVTLLGGSGIQYLVTVESRDRPGLLHDVTQVLRWHALEILSAHAVTDTEGVAIDCFVVRRLTGTRLRAGQVQQLRRQLMTRLAAG
jgi:UTP:GlnB (protein PII) uridylyltransferase